MKFKHFISLLGTYYTISTATIGTSILLFTFLNIISLIVLVFINPDPLIHQVKQKWGNCFPAQNEQTLLQLLNETWGRSYRYEPFLEHMERPFKGMFVNVAREGFRYIENQGPWPPQEQTLNIVVFGGSTTFGMGVSDSQTIPSYLQTILRTKLNKNVNVYNFGAGHYYSTMEFILFSKLVSKTKSSIDVALFIDGLNEFGHIVDQPATATEFQQVVDGRVKYSARTLLNQLPLVQLFTAVKSRNSEEPNLLDKDIPNQILSRYQTNKKLIESIANGFNIKTLFVFQPVPWYPPNDKNIDILMGEFPTIDIGYELAHQYYLSRMFGNNFIWAADLPSNFDCTDYVDSIHYSPKMALTLAEKISENLILILK